MFIQLRREPDPTHPLALFADMPFDAMTQHFKTVSRVPTCCPVSTLWQEALQRRKKQLETLYGSQMGDPIGDPKK